jgi:cephalosporin hydroxylase
MIRLDLEAQEIALDGPEGEERHALASPEAFAILTEAWVRSGWANRYSYTFTWLGRPIIQLPEDLIRLQELVYLLKPDIILETGIAHGGSLIYHAGLCRLVGQGRVIGIDCEIRPHNRAAIEGHALAPLITLIEGDSVAPETVAQVRELVAPGESVLLILDSNHSHGHVLAELETYAPLVKPGGYVVVADGVMPSLAGLPGAGADWGWNNPLSAIAAFLDRHPEFERAPPPCPFNEGGVPRGGSYWPGGYLRRIG